jgi:hypothetical protein
LLYGPLYSVWFDANATAILVRNHDRFAPRSLTNLPNDLRGHQHTKTIPAAWPKRLFFNRRWIGLYLLTPRCYVNVSGSLQFPKSFIASALKATNVLLHFPYPLVARLYRFSLRQPKTRVFEVLEKPVPSSQFHDEGAHTKSSRQCYAIRSAKATRVAVVSTS